jgi:copper chaperone NosL
MATNKLGRLVRILLLIGTISLVVSIYVPIWRIDLDAPQYPEGLSLFIYSNKLGGNVDIVNGLNHYIGMKTLHDKDFIEFTVLPYLIGFFAAAFLLTAIIAKRKLLNALLILFVCFGVLAMFDFWRWEYDYGHNLNSEAAIKVPGMSYQPPLIGFKQLLNFGAYSVPSIGGWLFISAGVLLVICVFLSSKKKSNAIFNTSAMAIQSVAILFFLSSCSMAPEPIKAGIDNCAYCKMTVSDLRYVSEIVTKKGRVFKFDDPHCLLSFLHSHEITKTEIRDIYFADFTDVRKFIKAGEAVFIQSDSLSTPMGGNIAAFAKQEAAEQAMKSYAGKMLPWNEINQ